ncbi:MAG: hypothetical protein JWQ38_2140 [Flavipsychrobacter sp.]|nr:hypothetical protein [Flavipsychrobacter sp.]
MLKKLLMRTQNRSRLWAALAALCIGTTLLLLSVMIWWNFRELLYGKNQNDTLGSTFLIIGKRVTEQNMGVANATVFTPQDINDLKTAPQVEDLGIISSNHFPVYAMMGGKLAFATDLALESVPDKFIDKMPAEWKWEAGSKDLPIIISSQFLDIYNYVFAPSQGLPQLSEGSVKSIVLNFKAGKDEQSEMFLAHVVGFSDRIGSVLAPQSFIDYGNKKWGKPGISEAPSQIILKTKDPSDTKFADYLQKHDYNTNSQNLRWSKIRAIVEVVTSATGVLALLLMGIGTLVFILFIELTIARAQNSLTLLLQVGYSPKYLSSFMTARFLPLVLGAVILSMIITIAGQVVTSLLVISQGLVLPTLPGWPVWVALVISTGILVLLVSKSISGAIKKT